MSDEDGASSSLSYITQEQKDAKLHTAETRSCQMLSDDLTVKLHLNLTWVNPACWWTSALTHREKQQILSLEAETSVFGIFA